MTASGATLMVGALACGGLMIAPATNAAEHPYHNTYATVGFDFTADPNQDGFPIGLTRGPAVGSFGKADIAILTEWLIQPRECPAGFDVPFGVVNVATVTTFQDLSQMFSFANEGWMCLNSTTGTFFGEVLDSSLGARAGLRVQVESTSPNSKGRFWLRRAMSTSVLSMERRPAR